MKNKKIILNKKGMILFDTMLIIALLLIAADPTKTTYFITTKIIGIILLFICYKMLKYIPKKYR